MRADALARRRLLIDAATELFRTTHPAEVTLEAVARKAGVGIATLYRNFADREELMVECAATALRRAVTIAADALEAFGNDPAAAWEGFVRGLVDLGVGPLVPALAPEHLTELPPAVNAVRDELASATAELLRRAQEAGLADPALTGAQFMAQLIVVTRPPISGVLDLDPDVTDRLVTALLLPPAR